MSESEFYSILKKLHDESRVDYLLSTCTKNPWNQASLSALEQEGKIKAVFSSGCAVVYAILP
jgi:hypothetical protein